jgi:hypothetical protein
MFPMGKSKPQVRRLVYALYNRAIGYEAKGDPGRAPRAWVTYSYLRAVPAAGRRRLSDKSMLSEKAACKTG